VFVIAFGLCLGAGVIARATTYYGVRTQDRFTVLVRWSGVIYALAMVAVVFIPAAGGDGEHPQEWATWTMFTVGLISCLWQVSEWIHWICTSRLRRGQAVADLHLSNGPRLR
jgi:hypothetical protein